MKTETIFVTIIAKMPEIPAAFHKFLLKLIRSFLTVKGKHNFSNLARWSGMHEKTFRRNYRKIFDFKGFNALFIDYFYAQETFIAVSDCSYIKKSGHKTYGLGKYWHGTMQKALKGLEISMIALVSISKKESFCLSIAQTPEKLTEENRLDFYLNQFSNCADYLRKKAKYWVADGFYAKQKAWDKVKSLGFEMISKLRTDANMQYIYQGLQKAKGRRKTNGGKVRWKAENLRETLIFEGLTSEGWQMYSQVLWSVQWKTKLKVVYLQWERKGKIGYALIAGSDLNLSAEKIVEYYRLRFQIEFLFRDAKQHLGLQDCQSTHKECLDFHFQAVMMCLNLARQTHYCQAQTSFSLYDLKTDYFNQHWLETIITK